ELQARRAREQLVYAIGDLRLAAVAVGLELDMELAAMRPPRVLALLGAADLLLDSRHSGKREQRCRQLAADAQPLVERRARRLRHLEHEVSLAKRRQEAAAEEWQHRGGCEREREHEREPARRMREPARQDRPVARLDPPLHRRLLFVDPIAAQADER